VPVASQDDELVARSRAGDPGALAELYRRHAGPLLRYLQWRAGSPSEAEDIVHEAFLRLFEGRGAYEPRGQFRAWLFRVATRIASGNARTQRRHDEILRTRPDSEACSQPQEPLGRAIQDRIDAVLAQLPPEYGLAFQLRVRENMPYRDIAAESGESEGTLRSRVHHTVKALRAALQPEAAAPSAPHRRSKEES